MKGTHQCDLYYFCGNGSFPNIEFVQICLQQCACLAFEMQLRDDQRNSRTDNNLFKLFVRKREPLPLTVAIHCFEAHTANLPGWCWAEIQQLALVGSSSSLHSEACNALGASDGVIHSSISLEVISLRAMTNMQRSFKKVNNCSNEQLGLIKTSAV